MKGKIRFFSILICLTLIVSIFGIKPAAAAREGAIPPSPFSRYIPEGIIYSKTPAFSWKISNGATYYRLSVYRRSDNQYVIQNVNIPASTYCKNNYCSFKPTTYINPMVYGTEYKWKIAAGNSEGLSAFSAFKYFIPKAGFNSTFTTSAAGWQPKVGTWTITSAGLYKGSSSTNQWISTRTDANYTNFSLEVSLYKAGTTDPYTYGVIIHGDTSEYNPDKMWNYGYFFAFNELGEYSVFRQDADGTYTFLLGWFRTTLIDPAAMNKIKINVSDGVMSYYINGVMVGRVYDNTYSTGRIGLIGYFDGVAMYADYAKLTVQDPEFYIGMETSGTPANCPPDPRGCFHTQP